MRALLFCQRVTELCYLAVLYEGRCLAGTWSGWGMPRKQGRTVNYLIVWGSQSERDTQEEHQDKLQFRCSCRGVRLPGNIEA